MYSQITLVGNIGADPMITKFEDGKKVARFSMATDSINKGSRNTEWHRLFAWGNIAEFVEAYAKKGKEIAITGKLVKRSYLSRAGQKLHFTEIEIQHIIGL